ncbi:MAG TPA: hypothetical protein VD930_06440, partial [Gemmatimonadales bacterium]|nr:hypothetical protein [Gemmatimonadales bacterium]
MPSFDDLHIQPAIASTLDLLGWTPDDHTVKEVAPTTARGHNLVAVTPPVPSYTTPALAGTLSRLERESQALVIVPAEQLDEWGALFYRLTQGTNLRVHVSRGTARAMRLLRSNSVGIVVGTPATALTLVSRSALQMDRVRSLVLAWPELMPDEDSIIPLMQDLPKESQRMVFTSDAARVGTLVERYARKALTTGVADAEASPVGPIRTVAVSWAGRTRALADLIELLDPASLAVWTADRRYHDVIGHSIASSQPEVQLVTEDAPPVGTVVAFDLPDPHRLRQLLTAGEVVVLVPPGG